MMQPTLSHVTVLVEQEDLEPFCEALSASGITFENAGAQRGAADTAELIVIVAPTLVGLAFSLEKLRRLRLPRTYLRPAHDGFDFWTDSGTRDGRVFVVYDDRIEELSDKEITAEWLRSWLRDDASAADE
jgi:hypothetical protein